MSSSFKNFLVYSASAGSGKTFALSLRYISLLFLGETPSNILATTFTRKAASQMQSRVRDYLLNLENEKEFLELLSKEIDLDTKSILSKKGEVLAKFLSSTNYIVTIDSFISSILRTNALEIGLEPTFTTVDNLNDLEKEFMEEINREGLMERFVELTLQMEEKRASSSLDLMIKLYNIDPLLPPKPKDINKNLKMIEDKIDDLRESIYQILKSIPTSNRAILNFAPASIKEFSKKSIFQKDTLHNHKYYEKYLVNYPKIESGFQELKRLICEWMKEKERKIISTLFELYNHYKNARVLKIKSKNILSFDDISYLAYRLLYNTINKEFLYFKLDSKFKHILLDEFQDTSTLQFLIFKPLVDEIVSGVGSDDFRSFFYVGDPKQSLYRFRGGREELFNWVAEYYNIPVKKLDTNYRSYKNIIDAVNLWFEGKMPEYIPQKSYSKKDGYVKVVESDKPLEDSIQETKKLLSSGVDIDSIAFLVFTNDEGIKLQNISSKESIKTILQTSSKLNRLSNILALTQACEYLYRGYEIDLYNLLLRVGIKTPNKVDFRWFNTELRPIEVLDRLIRIFDYFKDEVNILNLLEFASKYSELGEFLEEFENSRVPIATKSKYGATIMTIHNSKGLEFDYVIVIDKTKGDRANRDVLISKYGNSLQIEYLFYRIKGRENFDKSYAELIDWNNSLEKKDKLNMLYVALTRAKKGLVVVKSVKNSIFNEMTNISPIEIGTIEKSFKNPTDVVEINYPEITKYGSQEIDSLKEKSKREYDYYGVVFGSALHYTLEVMKSFDTKSLNLAIESTKNRFGVILLKDGLSDIKCRISHLIDSKEFQSLIKDASVSKEIPISYNGDLYQIDLMLKFEDRVIIIDYKSSKKDFYKHRKQVSNYCEIINTLMKKPTIGYICYLLKDRVEIEKIF